MEDVSSINIPETREVYIPEEPLSITELLDMSVIEREVIYHNCITFAAQINKGRQAWVKVNLKRESSNNWHVDGVRVPSEEVRKMLRFTSLQWEVLNKYLTICKEDYNSAVDRLEYAAKKKIRQIVSDSNWKTSVALTELGGLLEKNILIETHKTIKSLCPARMQEGRMENVPISDGVYFLKDGNEVVYVGKGCPIARRVGTHAHQKPKTGWIFDSATCLPMPGVPEKRILEVEAEYIRDLRPRYNKRS